MHSLEMYTTHLLLKKQGEVNHGKENKIQKEKDEKWTKNKP